MSKEQLEQVTSAKIYWYSGFKEPVNLISLFIASISLAYAIIIANTINTPRELSFALASGAPNKLLDVDSTIKTVALFDKNGRQIEHDLYIGQLALWNSGELSIVPSEMYRPLSLKLIGEGRIISVTPIAEIEPQITRITPKQIDDKTVVFDWSNLDLEMGSTFQVVYTSRELQGLTRNLFAVLYNTVRGSNNTLEVTGAIKEGRIVRSSKAFDVVFAFAFVGLIIFVPMSMLCLLAALFFRIRSPKIGLFCYKSIAILMIPSVISVIICTISIIYFFVVGVEPSGLDFGTSSVLSRSKP